MSNKLCQKLCKHNQYQGLQPQFENQHMTHVFQVPRVPPVHRGREERREIGDEKERREHEGPKEIKVLWDRQEKAGSKASWDLQGPKVT